MNTWQVIVLVALAAAVLGAAARRVRAASRKLDNLAVEGDGEYLA